MLETLGGRENCRTLKNRRFCFTFHEFLQVKCLILFNPLCIICPSKSNRPSLHIRDSFRRARENDKYISTYRNCLMCICLTTYTYLPTNGIDAYGNFAMYIPRSSIFLNLN
jgi:hypothetical protein